MIVHHEQRELLSRRLQLPPGTSLMAGRHELWLGEGAFDDSKISRRHARLAADRNGIHLDDLGSRNGTTVNGRRCMSAQLTEGDVVGLGPILLLVHRAPAEHRSVAHPTLIGRSYAISRVLQEIEQVAPHPTTVLLRGESGTGKELVAREIHRASRRTGPFVAVNCGAVAPALLLSELFGHARGAFTGADANRTGLLESSQGGTVFLDEIADASPALQVSLLRFLEDGEVRRVGDNAPRRVDTRVIAASHRDFEQLVRAGSFREDLLARLSAWEIHLPPLRARREDIPDLAAHFVRGFLKQDRPLQAALMLALLRYSWPRNVRELRTILERAAIEAGDAPSIPLSASTEALLTAEEAREGAPDSAVSSSRAQRSEVTHGLPRVSAKPSAEQLATLLAKHRGNVREIARLLGVSRNTMYRWFGEYSIPVERFRER